MDRQTVETLAVGAGPANLALAIALEELAPEDVAGDLLIVEQHDDVAWQRGMLLPWAQSQVSFLKDLVTLRNPRSRYSFLNYLHDIGRLDEFINLGSFTPYRVEISGYLGWVAHSLASARIEYGRRCVSIEPQLDDDRTVRSWVARFDDGGEVACTNLVIGAGRDAYVPPEFAGLPRERVIHSTEFAARIGELDPSEPHRVVVVGGAQSAAEMLWATYQACPKAGCTMLMRSIGLNNYESSKFTNELFYPSFVDRFHDALPSAREQLLREMHRTNYSGLAPGMLDTLYREIYLQKLTGEQRLSIVPMTEVHRSEMDGDEVVLTVTDRRTGRDEELRCDRVMLGTGFVKQMPRIIQSLADAVGLQAIRVTRDYRLELPERSPAACYLQGVNEATHGIADSLLSVLAIRSADIVSDMLARRTAELTDAVPAR